MSTSPARINDSLPKRVLCLYGLFMLLSNAAYVLAYYFLPEGLLRGTAVQGSARTVAAAGTFWSQLALIFLVNLGLLMALSVSFNLLQFKGFPLGYLWLVGTAIMSGVIAGTNSFLQSDLTQFNVRDGMALSLSIGGLEFLAYVLIIASTVSLAAYEFNSWTQLKPTKLKNIRDIRLSTSEVIGLIIGILLLFLAAYRETALTAGL